MTSFPLAVASFFSVNSSFLYQFALFPTNRSASVQFLSLFLSYSC